MHLSFNIARNNNVIFVSYGAGLLRSCDIAPAQEQAQEWFDCRTAGLLLDIRKCVVAVGLDSMAAARPGWEAYVSLPQALLVSPGALELYRAYSWQAAQEGYMRKAFTCQAAALEWIRARAAVARSA